MTQVRGEPVFPSKKRGKNRLGEKKEEKEPPPLTNLEEKIVPPLVVSREETGPGETRDGTVWVKVAGGRDIQPECEDCK
jgi:hypothetical protein